MRRQNRSISLSIGAILFSISRFTWSGCFPVTAKTGRTFRIVFSFSDFGGLPMTDGRLAGPGKEPAVVWQSLAKDRRSIGKALPKDALHSVAFCLGRGQNLCSLSRGKVCCVAVPVKRVHGVAVDNSVLGPGGLRGAHRGPRSTSCFKNEYSACIHRQFLFKLCSPRPGDRDEWPHD